MTIQENGIKHIAIVDDEPVNLALAENALKGNYKLTKLVSGEQLLRFLKRIKPDMILLDVQMPDMNGYEVLSKLSEDPNTKDIPVIFLTSQDGADSEKMGFRLGAKDFIKKPFDNEIMHARIQSQMELYTYRTHLEDIIEEKATQIANLQHVLTVSWAEMIESRDGTTGAHVRNTTSYFKLLVNELAKQQSHANELPEAIVGELLRASTLHDIGKIGISDTILKKPGPLDKEEFKQMQMHSQIGADMIDKIMTKTDFDNFLNYAKAMARFHHERWDGSGYPCGLNGLEIPVYVRALSIVDVYDALTSVRPYKRAFTHTEALEIINEESGKFFDPDIFATFINIEDKISNIVKAEF